jgi:hypothetical protein
MRKSGAQRRGGKGEIIHAYKIVIWKFKVKRLFTHERVISRLIQGVSFYLVTRHSSYIA